MPQIDKERFFKMATCYDRMTSYLVPRYNMLQSEIVAICRQPNVTLPRAQQASCR